MWYLFFINIYFSFASSTHPIKIVFSEDAYNNIPLKEPVEDLQPNVSISHQHNKYKKKLITLSQFLTSLENKSCEKVQNTIDYSYLKGLDFIYYHPIQKLYFQIDKLDKNGESERTYDPLTIENYLQIHIQEITFYLKTIHLLTESLKQLYGNACFLELIKKINACQKSVYFNIDSILKNLKNTTLFFQEILGQANKVSIKNIKENIDLFLYKIFLLCKRFQEIKNDDVFIELMNQIKKTQTTISFDIIFKQDALEIKNFTKKIVENLSKKELSSIATHTYFFLSKAFYEGYVNEEKKFLVYLQGKEKINIQKIKEHIERMQQKALQHSFYESGDILIKNFDFAKLIKKIIDILEQRFCELTPLQKSFHEKITESYKQFLFLSTHHLLVHILWSSYSPLKDTEQFDFQKYKEQLYHWENIFNDYSLESLPNLKQRFSLSCEELIKINFYQRGV